MLLTKIMRNPLLDEAATAFDRDDVRLAEELYLKCLAQDPQDAEAWPLQHREDQNLQVLAELGRKVSLLIVS